MEIEKKLNSLAKKIAASEQKIAKEKATIEQCKKEIDSLRYLRYTQTLKECDMTDDELIAFLKNTKKAVPGEEIAL